MVGKQFITDIVVVVVLPLFLIGGYYIFQSNDGALLSFAAPTTTNTSGQEGQELGAKTVNALALLRSIPTDLDQSLFSDRAYLMLKDYQVTIPTVPLGRANPFTLPPALESISRFSRTSNTAPVVVAPASANSAKMNDLKGSK